MTSPEDMPVLDGPTENTNYGMTDSGYSSGYSSGYGLQSTEAEELARFRKMAMAIRDADLDGDGKIAENELEIHLKKLQTQRKIAIVALAVLCFLGIYITIFLPIARIEQVANALDLLWITLGGVIATYMGAEAYVSRKS
ncbi:hypothetical protein PHIN3_121 [Sinorhizobium phage phiN3]|uniref:EF-hand domain-containing protein n=1 Tax=Sinorhizobium phage phiN3 TaxID=1647405 RepID=A0A0F6WCS9_9CAUD|nr:hypothetical protein AVT40_gp121 [Sinorhizobium phage phiN3]AKF13386.1 hypothetical protein PHIN3_121 [Sinorhizobium phage phiN3]